jgi:hypothetical protein
VTFQKYKRYLKLSYLLVVNGYKHAAELYIALVLHTALLLSSMHLESRVMALAYYVVV